MLELQFRFKISIRRQFLPLNAKNLQILVIPFSAEICIGVFPWLSATLKLAPCADNSCNISRSPFAAALK